METWEVCQEFPKYVVSPEGVVKNRVRGTPVKTRQNKQGIVQVTLMREDTVRLTRSLALIVARLYLQPPPNDSYNSVIHLDGDKTNCKASNLMWRPRWYALLFHRMFSEHPSNTSVLVEETGETFGTLREACLKYGLYDKYTYVDMRNNDPCFHYRFHFKEFYPV